MNKREIEILFNKYRAGTCTSEEIALLESWYLQYANDKDRVSPNEQVMRRDLKLVWTALPVDNQRFVVKHRYRRIAAAAAVFISLIGGLYWYRMDVHPERRVVEAVPKPVRGEAVSKSTDDNEAYLILDNGKRISLDEKASGTLYENTHTRIQKAADAKIVYDESVHPNAIQSDDGLVFNTIVIPKTKQYQLVLADGTQVWLNSLSSIRFPTHFSKDQRSVEVTGEAYFEVAKDAERPFIVKAGHQTIKVLGTHFNVSAYPEEGLVKTTLLEGSVEVSVGNMQSGQPLIRRLTPGHQAQSSATKTELNVVSIDVGNAIAWKRGLIQFKDADLESILRQVSRWYDVEIEYEGVPPQRHFTGGILKQAPLSDFLKVLELNAIQFTQKNKKIIIHQE